MIDLVTVQAQTGCRRDHATVFAVIVGNEHHFVKEAISVLRPIFVVTSLLPHCLSSILLSACCLLVMQDSYALGVFISSDYADVTASPDAQVLVVSAIRRFPISFTEQMTITVSIRLTFSLSNANGPARKCPSPPSSLRFSYRVPASRCTVCYRCQGTVQQVQQACKGRKQEV